MSLSSIYRSLVKSRTYNHLNTVMFFVISFVIAHCKHSSSSQMTGVVTAGDIKWPQATAQVCWENPEAMSPDLLVFMENLVVSEYNTKTVFKFVPGWKKCEPSSRGVRVFFSSTERLSHTKGGGRMLDGLNYGVTFAFLNPKSETYKCTGKLLYACSQEVIHEFGHVIGLRHEQVHAHSTCDMEKGKNSISLGAYDPFSIMNYCFMFYGGATELGALSPGDVATINTFYSSEGDFVNNLNPSIACQKDGFSWQNSEEACCQIPKESKYPQKSPMYPVCNSAKNTVRLMGNFSSEDIPDAGNGPAAILSCTTDNQKTIYFRNNWAPGQDPKVLTFDLPPWQDLHCGKVYLSNDFGEPTGGSSYFLVTDPKSPSFKSGSLTLNGSLTSIDYLDSPFATFMPLEIQLPMSSKNLGIQSVRLTCKNGLFWGKIADQNKEKAQFSVSLPPLQRQEGIPCQKIEAFNGSSKYNSTKRYELPLSSTAKVGPLTTKNRWDLASASWATVSQKYAVCAANNGRGYGYPFKCAQEDCAFTSRDKIGSKKAGDWCLFRMLDI